MLAISSPTAYRDLRRWSIAEGLLTTLAGAGDLYVCATHAAGGHPGLLNLAAGVLTVIVGLASIASVNRLARRLGLDNARLCLVAVFIAFTTISLIAALDTIDPGHRPDVCPSLC